MKNCNMLKRFEVCGFRAFKDRIIFDLSAREYEFNCELVREGVVKNALIYGPNGIGKSCLGFALFDLVTHLSDNKSLNPKYLTEYQNIGLRVDDPVLFKYVFSFSDDEVVYEYAKSAKKELQWERLEVNGRQIVKWNFENADDCDIATLSEKGLRVDLSDNKLSMIKYIYRNLPTGTMTAIDRLMAFVDGMLWYRSLSDGNSYAGFTNGSASIDSEICRLGKLAGFMEFLKANDLVYDLISKTVENEERIFVRDSLTNREMAFNNIASTGTRTLMLFYYWSILAFDKLTFLFVDEFDAFFHYRTAAEIAKRLSHSTFQSVLTSHNTYLMQNEITRPDCCYIMGPGKVRCLPECTDREIREAHNLEKMYQNGVFVA